MGGEQGQLVRESWSCILSEYCKSKIFQLPLSGPANYPDRFDDDLLGDTQT
jgi:hypothetical protein